MVLDNDVYDLLEASTISDTFSFKPGFGEIDSSKPKTPPKITLMTKIKKKIVQHMLVITRSIRVRHFFLAFLMIFLLSALRITSIASDVSRNVRIKYNAIERHMKSISINEINNEVVTMDEHDQWRDRYLEAIGEKVVGFEKDEWMDKYNEAVGRATKKVVISGNEDTSVLDKDMPVAHEDEDADAWSNTYVQAMESHRKPRGWEYPN